jgi:hypothetical protein
MQIPPSFHISQVSADNPGEMLKAFIILMRGRIRNSKAQPIRRTAVTEVKRVTEAFKGLFIVGLLFDMAIQGLD